MIQQDKDIEFVYMIVYEYKVQKESHLSVISICEKSIQFAIPRILINEQLIFSAIEIARFECLNYLRIGQFAIIFPNVNFLQHILNA